MAQIIPQFENDKNLFCILEKLSRTFAKKTFKIRDLARGAKYTKNLDKKAIFMKRQKLTSDIMTCIRFSAKISLQKKTSKTSENTNLRVF